MYGELVIFETGVHGLVLNVERNCIGCVLLGSDHGLMEGSKVARTGVQADIPVGDAMIGRVVNAYQCLWRQVSFPSTLCSRSDVDSVS